MNSAFGATVGMITGTVTSVWNEVGLMNCHAPALAFKIVIRMMVLREQPKLEATLNAKAVTARSLATIADQVLDPDISDAKRLMTHAPPR